MEELIPPACLPAAELGGWGEAAAGHAQSQLRADPACLPRSWRGVMLVMRVAQDCCEDIYILSSGLSDAQLQTM